jgi:predicted AlkP superfamily phosphohydrolase/phosphomutase
MDLLSEHEYQFFVERLLDGIERKTKASAALLAHGNWDLFLVVFKEAHCVAHQCWHLLDESHAAHSAKLAQALRNPIKRVYQALDAAIGQLLASADSTTRTIVFSDLGMGPNYTGEHLLDQVLLRLERSHSSRPQRAMRAFGLLKNKVQRRILGANGGLHARANRLAFQVEHNEISGAIRINLIGREQRGLIRPGTDYEEFCQWLSEEMLALLNPDTGQCIVDAVLHSDMVYKGEHLDRLPDLIVVWNRSAPISAVASPAIGELRVAGPGNRTGNHVSGGFYVGSGPGVVPGEQSGPASIMDLAPTIAELLRTPLPGTDGKPIPALSGAGFASHSATGPPEQDF